MVKTSIGELKLSPMKEEGRFVFYNDLITINGKVSKGDRVNLLVEGYDVVGDTHHIRKGTAPKAVLVVRGEKHEHTDTDGHATVEDFYRHISEMYKTKFYFAKKV